MLGCCDDHPWRRDGIFVWVVGLEVKEPESVRGVAGAENDRSG